jgi:hypothetical protein
VGPRIGAMLSEMRCRDVLLIDVPEEKNLGGHNFQLAILATGNSAR